MSEEYWVVLIKKENEFYMLANRDRSLLGKNSSEEFINEFTASYVLASQRGIPGSTSAFLHNFTFAPSIVQMSLNEIQKEVFDLASGVEFKIHKNIYGSMPLLKCNGKKDLSKIFEEGIKPKLKFEDI